MKSVLILFIMVLTMSACTAVAPWQRGTLAKPEMQLNADSMNQNLADHVYFSREAANGGRGFSGGGCGCN